MQCITAKTELQGQELDLDNRCEIVINEKYVIMIITMSFLDMLARHNGS